MTDEFLTITQLAARLSVRERVISRYVDAGTIPHRKLGKTVRFRWRDVEAWWEALPGATREKVPVTFPDPRAATNGIYAVPEDTNSSASTFTRGAPRQVRAPSIPRHV